MTYKEESYVLDTLKEILLNTKEIHENNIMLKLIIKVINTYILNHNNENNDDFMRNIMANLISNGLDFNKFRNF